MKHTLETKIYLFSFNMAKVDEKSLWITNPDFPLLLDNSYVILVKYVI